MPATATLLCMPVGARTPLRVPCKLKNVSFLNTKKMPNIVVSDKVFVKEKKRLELGGRRLHLCNGVRRNSRSTTTSTTGGGSGAELDDNLRKLLQTVLWIAEVVYVLWLFLLPYAPGDPVWAISSETIKSLLGLSLNFFFILPLSNSAVILNSIIRIASFRPLGLFHDIEFIPVRIVGVHIMEAPVLHPMSEGLFNFVIGWTFMFAPLLYTDRKRDRYKGSLDVLWGLQMFLTNTFLIPYMAIRLNEADVEYRLRNTSQLGSVMTKGAPVVGLIGAAVCLLSTLWALYGRADGNFGSLAERLEFLISYLGSERLAYAFVWDICLYVVFQPWLIGENLQNIQKDRVGIVSYLRFIPVVGLVAYCLWLNHDEEIWLHVSMTESVNE